MSVQDKLAKVGVNLVAQLGNKVYHYWRPVKSAPICIWQEDSEAGSLRVDRIGREQAIHGTVDYYTQTEYDGNIDKIQTALNKTCSNWSINSVQYEDDTKLIHYEWEFTVI